MLQLLLGYVLRVVKYLKIHERQELSVEVEDALTDKVFVLGLHGILL